MRHIYLSPHLDDAVLSCGGTIHRRTMAGDPVQVITIFSGEYRGRDLSSFAREQHNQWGNWPQIMALRRAEDQAALTLLGADGRYLDRLDAVYRSDANGAWMYVDLETLFGDVNPADPMALEGVQGLVDQLGNLIPLDGEQVVYAPLGVGHHVDHQIVHEAARQLLAAGYRVAFYEDYPYGEWPGAIESALAVAAAESWGTEWISLDPANVAAKVSALGYYRSQIAVLFGGAEAMPGRVWTFAATRTGEAGLTERIWWPIAV
jgi:LmbE family N-acetylglucosaminyl deacetylase